jgi:hypothetical protein
MIRNVLNLKQNKWIEKGKNLIFKFSNINIYIIIIIHNTCEGITKMLFFQEIDTQRKRINVDAVAFDFVIDST